MPNIEPMPRFSLVALIALSLAVPGHALAASSTSISGTVSGAPKGAKVMALPTQGAIVTSSLKKGAFSVKVKPASVSGLSLQLLGSDGSYLGPVVLYAKGAKGSVRFGKLKVASLKLGAIQLRKGYATLKTPLAKQAVLLSGSGAVKLVKGAPAGAGTLGKTNSGAKASQAGQAGGNCGSQQATENGAGGDCDRDGVPNVVDVDDNGNGSLDGVDPASAQGSASANPFFSIRPHFRNQVNVYAGATRASINSYLGASSEETGLNMIVYLNQRTIDPLSQTPFANVWITCSTGQPWCAPGSATAKVSGLGDVPPIDGGSDRFAQNPWFTFHGSRCTDSCSPLGGSDPNSLAQISRGGDPVPTYVASVRPSASDTFGQVVPGDLLTLNARTAAGAVTTLPMTIPPYFVTSPALASYALPGAEPTNVSYPVTSDAPGSSAGNPIQLDDSGKLTVRLWRPQRFALTGESGEYFDIGGLKWGVGVESYFENGQFRSIGRPTACPVSDLVGLQATAPSQFSTITMADTVTTDTPTDASRAAERTIGFTVDVKACLAAAGAPTGSGIGTLVGLIAMGAEQPGGANTTGADFEVRLP